MTYRAIYLGAAAAFLTIFGSAIAADSTGFEDKFPTIDTTRWYVSNGWTNGPHQGCEWRADALSTSDKGLLMTLSDRGGKVLPLGCPELHTKQRLSYGRFEARMRTAAGSGLNTAFFSYVGPGVGVPEWDEIDFEFLGKDPTKVELNHTAQGTKVKGKVLDLGFDSSKAFHDYAFNWTKTGIVWYVDGKEVHRTPAGVPLPRNATYLYFSLWSGTQIEDSWMGKFTYTKPVTAEVQWTRYTPAAQ